MTIKASGRWALIAAAAIWISTLGPLHAQLWPETPAAQPAASTEQPVALGKPIALNRYIKHRSRHSRRRASSHSRKHRTARKETRSTRAVDEARISDRSNEPEAGSKANDSRLQDSADSKLDPRVTEADAASPVQNGFTGATLSSSVANARAQLLSSMGAANETAAPAAQAAPAATALANARPEDGSPRQATAAASVVAPDELNEVDRAASGNSETTPAVALASISAAPAAAETPTAAAGADDSAWVHASMIGKIFIAFGGLLTLASVARMLMA